MPKSLAKGVLRDAHGVLVLEFQRPDDPLDVQMELAELIISRDEVHLYVVLGEWCWLWVYYRY